MTLPPPRASVSSSVKWVECGLCPTGLILLNPQRKVFGTSELLVAAILGAPVGHRVCTVPASSFLFFALFNPLNPSQQELSPGLGRNLGSEVVTCPR